MDRWAAADLLREAIGDRFGSVEAGAAAGLKLRHDGGSCFRSAHYQAEIDYLAIDRSPAFHYEPETNGVVEKFIQTLKEQVLWIEQFDTLEQLRARIRQFAHDYNQHWLLERHGYRHHAKPATRSVNTPWHDHPRSGVAAWRESGIKEPEQEIITAGRYEVLSSVPESLEEGATLVVELREVDTITQRGRPDQPPRETSK